ncbi:alpha/beta fold hydrolase, partial [Aurantibacter sp.]|uniref:alpha/beta fold hydrolase n=1 Tax=Aurantibacter sp. TaxID=2807103 RepID=UPI003267E84C
MRFFLLLLFSIFFFACSSDSEGIIIDGILEVPENRDNPNSRTLNLEYKILKAKDTTSRKNPIVYLQGGPGGATIVMEGFWKNHSLRNDRDIILMDQRGTGKSEANCTDIGKAMMTILRKDLNSHQEIKLQDSILSICKENMKRKRIDLAGYNSRENAADFEDLRKILGYEKWNLWGVSYGTRLGLTIMRDYPKRIRSAVLAGILAPETAHLNNSIIDFEHSLFSVLKRCEENESCNERYPNLKERLLKTFKNIKSQPLRFNYKGIPFTLNYQDALL